MLFGFIKKIKKNSGDTLKDNTTKVLLLKNINAGRIEKNRSSTFADFLKSKKNKKKNSGYFFA
jgi:hypothetical protein